MQMNTNIFQHYSDTHRDWNYETILGYIPKDIRSIMDEFKQKEGRVLIESLNNAIKAPGTPPYVVDKDQIGCQIINVLVEAINKLFLKFYREENGSTTHPITTQMLVDYIGVVLMEHEELDGFREDYDHDTRVHILVSPYTYHFNLNHYQELDCNIYAVELDIIHWSAKDRETIPICNLEDPNIVNALTHLHNVIANGSKDVVGSSLAAIGFGLELKIKKE